MLPVPEKFLKAIARRSAIESPATDCLRYVDGPGDGLGDLVIDGFAGRWLVQTRNGPPPDWLKNVSGPRSIYWKRLDQTDKQPPMHLAGELLSEPFLALENGIRYVIDFAAGYSQGIFLDQRNNRLRLRELCRSGDEVLNLFSYTCAFSVCAAAAGAHTVSVDLSRPSLEWGQRNFAANEMDPAGQEFIAGEAADWLKRFGKKGRKFDLIVIDPPTFSRDKKGKVFRIERDFGKLSGAAMMLLRPRGALLCTTNQRTLTRPAFQSLIQSGAENATAWKFTFAPMPPDFTGEPYLKTCWVSRR